VVFLVVFSQRYALGWYGAPALGLGEKANARMEDGEFLIFDLRFGIGGIQGTPGGGTVAYNMNVLGTSGVKVKCRWAGCEKRSV
jgi:hypothetical protein